MVMNKQLIFFILLIMSIIMFYLGMNENIKNYEESWDYIFGNIIEKNIETLKSTKKNGKIDRLELYETEYKYRLKIKFDYQINNIIYTGLFYNDGNNDIYLNNYKLIKYLYNLYDYNYPLKIYFDKKNNKSNCLHLDYVKTKRVRLYYCAGCIMFICSILSIFFI